VIKKRYNKAMKHRHFLWLASALLIIVVFGTIYAVVQQSERRSANMPQVQLAKDAARSIRDQRALMSISSEQVDIKDSLSPFIIIYNTSGMPVKGNGYLDGKLATAPKGMLEASKNRDNNTVTWQPQSGVRIAAVTVSAGDYYVLVGRSLREVEKNEERTLQITAVAGLVSLLILGAMFVASRGKTGKKKTL
jgi:hypothetical protein